jgi:hypothetical protein
MEMDVAVRTSETSVDNHFIRQYIPEDNSEHFLAQCIFWYSVFWNELALSLVMKKV